MVVVNIKINPLIDKQKEVMQTLLSMVEAMEAAKGCLSYKVFCDVEDKTAYNLIEEWETREDLDRHMGSDMFGVLLGTKSLLCEAPKIQIHTVSRSEVV